MNSPTSKEAIEPVDSGSSSKQKQAGNDLFDVIASKLRGVDYRPGLRSITLVITLDRKGKPRTVIFRTETKSELSS